MSCILGNMQQRRIDEKDPRTLINRILDFETQLIVNPLHGTHVWLAVEHMHHMQDSKRLYFYITKR
jgi:hypothetical protein